MLGKLRLALMIPLAMACAACGTVRVETPKPPAHLLTCADDATPPDLAPVPWALGNLTEIQRVQAERDRQTFEYILAERSAGGDCRSKVKGVRAWTETLP